MMLVWPQTTTAIRLGGGALSGSKAESIVETSQARRLFRSYKIPSTTFSKLLDNGFSEDVLPRFGEVATTWG